MDGRDTTGEPVFDIAPGADADDWLNTRTDTRLLLAEQRLAQDVVKANWKDYWPTIYASFDPQYLTPPGLFQLQKTWRLTFTLQQDIYVGGARKGLHLEREADLQTADFALVQKQIQARAEIRNARYAIEGYERVLASARRAAEEANEVLKITITAFDAGASTNIEVIDAQRGARDIEAAVAQAEDALRQAQFDLLVALGRFPR